METLYEKNGLVFWTEPQIRMRELMVRHFVGELQAVLREQNRAFEMLQVEAPLLTPRDRINKQYTPEDIFITASPLGIEEMPDGIPWKNIGKFDDIALRPETTMGSYTFAKWLLDHQKIRLPLCVWQHGKSFRREQDQPLTKMRLKEFWQLEFQIIYGLTTANDYGVAVIPAMQKMIAGFIGPCRVEDSDRLPDYSERTLDVVCERTNMEVCSISYRKDFTAGLWANGKETEAVQMAKVLEVAIGTDRCVYNWIHKKYD